MLAVVYRKKFKKNLDLMIRRGKSPEKIKEVILALASGTPLDSRYKDHALSGSFYGFRDCHIDPDSDFDGFTLTTVFSRLIPQCVMARPRIPGCTSRNWR